MVCCWLLVWLFISVWLGWVLCACITIWLLWFDNCEVFDVVGWIYFSVKVCLVLYCLLCLVVYVAFDIICWLLGWVVVGCCVDFAYFVGALICYCGCWFDLILCYCLYLWWFWCSDWLVWWLSSVCWLVVFWWKWLLVLVCYLLSLRCLFILRIYLFVMMVWLIVVCYWCLLWDWLSCGWIVLLQLFSVIWVVACCLFVTCYLAVYCLHWLCF